MPLVMTSTIDWSDIDPNAITKRVMEELAPGALERIKAGWPKATGRSAAAWKWAVTETAGEVRLSFTNGVGYAGHVKARGSRLLSVDVAASEVLAPLAVEIADEVRDALLEAYRAPGPAREVVSG